MLLELFTFLSQFKQKRSLSHPRFASQNKENARTCLHMQIIKIKALTICPSVLDKSLSIKNFYYKKRAGKPGPFFVRISLLDNPLRQHRVCNLEKARDIRADHKVILMAIFLRCGGHIGVNIHHNIFQILIHLVK